MTEIRLCLFIFLTFFVFSCRTSTEEVKLKGNEYYPLTIGTSKLYKVDTIIYDAFKKEIDTISNVFKEMVVEKYPDLSGDTVYRIELSKFSEDKQMYIVFKSFERSIKGNYAMEKLENRNEVKMLFPISNFKTKGNSYTWNANMFIESDPVIVKYTSVFTGFNNGLKAYNDCVSIKLSKPQLGIVNKVREEVYAKNVGLVYRYSDSTDLLLDTFPSGKKIIVKLIN